MSPALTRVRRQELAMAPNKIHPPLAGACARGRPRDGALVTVSPL